MSTNETVRDFMEMTGQKQETPKWLDKIFVHATPKPDLCKHDFQGWRDFEDGNGGEQVCTKCGMGAMAHTLSIDF